MTESSPERKLAAIVAADVVGYSRLMGEDETGTLAKLKALREQQIEPRIAAYHGRTVKLMGDGILLEFPSIVDALACAVEVQRAVAQTNEDIVEAERIQFRIGINLGDIIIQDDDIYGDGVNIAARLEPLAEPGGICLSQAARDFVGNKLPLDYEDMGEQQMKNIAEPVRVYRVRIPVGAVMPTTGSAFNKPTTYSFKHRRMWSALAALAVIALVAVFFLLYEPKPVPQTAVAIEADMVFPLPDRPSIAVLPFDNMSGDPKQDYFSDGMTESLITTLSKIPQLFVIARNSTFTYKGKAVSIKQVAEELGVRYVLEGSVQRSGDRVRINAQLIDALTGHHLWAEQYDRQATDIFELQDDINRHVMTEVEVNLTEGEIRRVWHRQTNNLEAYQLHLQGQKLSRRFTRPDMKAAQQLYEKAIALDKNFATAWAGLGWCYMNYVRKNWVEDIEDARNKAREFAQTALTYDSTDPRALLLLTDLHLDQGEIDDGKVYLEKAMASNPNNTLVYFFYGDILVNWGEFERGLEFVQKAIRLSPHHPSFYVWSLGKAYYWLEDYDKAIAALETYVNSYTSKTAWTYIDLAYTYAGDGQLEKAQQVVNEILKRDPEFSISRYKTSYRVKWYKDPAMVERVLNDLRKAGLPE